MKLLNFRIALIIAEAGALRIAVAKVLKNQGWLVQAVRRAEQAFQILAHIPYELIVMDSDLPGMSGIEFARILYNSKDWRAIRVLVISSSPSAALVAEAIALGAFLATKAEWEENPFRFLRILNKTLAQEA